MQQRKSIHPNNRRCKLKSNELVAMKTGSVCDSAPVADAGLAAMGTAKAAWHLVYKPVSTIGSTSLFDETFSKNDPHDIPRVRRPPFRLERQADGRIRYWAYIPRLKTYIRVVTLADGETVHNVFKDNDFTE